MDFCVENTREYQLNYKTFDITILILEISI